jgi:hypothetical protein
VAARAGKVRSYELTVILILKLFAAWARQGVAGSMRQERLVLRPVVKATQLGRKGEPYSQSVVDAVFALQVMVGDSVRE